MNAEQLHTIASTVIEDVSASDILAKFNNLHKQLNQLASNPGDQKLQQDITTLRRELFDALNALQRRRWPSGIQQTIELLGGGILVSGEIQEGIERIFQTESISPATVRDHVNGVMSEIKTFVDKLTALKTAFDALDIKEEPLEPGEVELGVLIPRSEVKNKLDLLANELMHFDKIFKYFSVVAIGTREEFELTYLSASDLKIFVRPNAKTVALISATVTFILTSLNQIADLKMKYDEFLKSGIEEKHLEGLKKGINEKLAKDLEAFRAELIEQFCGDKKEADKNENSTRLKIAIDHLAPRLERGWSLEVRLGPLPAPTEGSAEEGEGAGKGEDHALYEKLQDDAQRLKRLAPIGTPILSLPKPETLFEDGKDD
ncbi:hypothetical protein HY624_03080 [Candidatus Uhrbacteria bacterium]|nr:hypothetical protein [Candidatus Uhrbacteria bacterium]